MSNNNNSEPLFSIFEKKFQEQIFQAMLLDRKWASQFCEVIKPEYFDFAYLRKLTEYYLNFQQKYKDFPSMSLMITIVKENLKNDQDVTLKSQIIDCLKRIAENKDIGDLSYVKEKSLEYCKRMALKKALSECVDLISTNKYESTVDIIRKAINLGTENSIGLSLSDDIEARYTQLTRKTIGTGIKELDDKKILNGGLGAGEIGIVVAPTSHGKTHFLVQIGANALKQKKNVLHYSLEMKESNVGIRYDSNFIKISSTDCFEYKEMIQDFYKNNNDSLGKLIIKQYPTSTVTINQLRAHIEKLSGEGFIPDLVVIDYIGIMRSTERYELLRLEMKKVVEEVRGLSQELNIPIWTALQSNKDGSKADVIDETNLAESYAQAHVADLILGLVRNKKTGYGRLSIPKNRAGMDGIDFPIHLDTSTSTLRIITETEQQEQKELEEEQKNENVSNALKSAYKNSKSIDNILQDINFKIQ